MSAANSILLPEEGGRVIEVNPAARRDTTAWAGMTVFLGSWAMMFAALFLSYALIRAQEPIWPPLPYAPLPLGLPGLNTLVVALSSVSLVWAIASMRRGGSLAPGLVGAIGLGTVFLGLQWAVWSSLWTNGFEVTSGHYGGVFYLLTVFHALHVLVGLGLLVGLLPKALGEGFAPHQRSKVQLTSMFWHFVGVVWLLLFLIVYVL